MYEFPCPACGESIVHLSHYGRCPICAAPISAQYVGMLGKEWVPACATFDELCALLRDERFRLVHSLEWVDL